jgi:hypothetical protein
VPRVAGGGGGAGGGKVEVLRWATDVVVGPPHAGTHAAAAAAGASAAAAAADGPPGWPASFAYVPAATNHARAARFAVPVATSSTAVGSAAVSTQLRESQRETLLRPTRPCASTPAIAVLL